MLSALSNLIHNSTQLRRYCTTVSMSKLVDDKLAGKGQYGSDWIGLLILMRCKC